MIIIDIKGIVKVCFSICVLNVIAQDGIIRPMGESSNGSNKCVSVKMVLAKDDPALPDYMTIYKPESDFVVTGNVANASVKVGGKIHIENNSDWPYVFGRQCMRAGYYSLEIDMMLDNGNIVCMRKRSPKLLHENGSFITLQSHRQWECLISFDKRLWELPVDIIPGKVTKIRPRFAFGAYNAGGTYYRTIEEIKNARKKERRFDDRDGELVGDWIDCDFNSELSAER